MSVRKRQWETNAGVRGSWIVDYRDIQGVRRQSTFKTKKAADEWAARTTVRITRGPARCRPCEYHRQQAGARWIFGSEP